MHRSHIKTTFIWATSVTGGQMAAVPPCPPDARHSRGRAWRRRDAHACAPARSILVPMSDPARIPVRRDLDRATFEASVLPAARPVVLADLVGSWPAVRAARESRTALAQLLGRFDSGRWPHVIEAPAESGGRLFYSDDMTAFNFTRRPVSLGQAIERLLALADTPAAPALFLESMSTRAYLPGFADDHHMALLPEQVEPRVWIGNAVKVNTHFDLACNIACVVGGRRRFTLFPPEQLENLYMAPLDFTPSGAPVSLVEFTRPDHERFPRFAEALRHA